MVTVVSVVPDRSVVKEVICRNCGSKLEYVPADIQKHSYKDYDGTSNTDYFIICPPCSNRVIVR